MPLLQTQAMQEQNHGRESRSQSIATRFTPAEVRILQQHAKASGQNLREWARDRLLRNADHEEHGEMEVHIFTELVGIEMLLMNAFEQILRGNTLTSEQVSVLFRQAQTTKAAKAQEILARRGQKQEK